MNALRTAEAPAPAQEASQSANPLLPLIADSDAEQLIIALLQRLSCDAQSAKWIDELLEDERLDLLHGVREEAVKVLLNFGHPHALLISPEDLIRFRRARPLVEIRSRWIAGAATVSAALCGLWLLAPLQWPFPTLTAALALWPISVAVRVLRSQPMSKAQLMGEVALGLCAAAVGVQCDSVFGWAALSAVLPIALTGLAGGWNDD